MRGTCGKKPVIRMAVVDSDPLRFVGFRSLLSCESDFELQSVSLASIGTSEEVDVVLLGSHPGQNAIGVLLTTIRTMRPRTRVIVTGCNMDDAAILKAISAGAKGCVDEAAPVDELVRAIRVVQSGSIWAPRRVLAMFLEKSYRSSRTDVCNGQRQFTSREKEVLRMLVVGCSNKEIAVPLGIEERTVKAHVAKLMQKVGVPNRVVLSVQTITQSLVASTES
jgi:DNA-binding NarL/FixJ family response regulator